jgi:hypothetical protein
MRSAEQCLSEGLKLAAVLLNLRAEQIGEQVAANAPYDLPVFSNSVTAALGVAHEIGFDTDQRSEVIDKPAATAEYVETGDARDLGVDVDERKANWDFDLRVILRD